jgi:uncharacterized protein
LDCRINYLDGVLYNALNAAVEDQTMEAFTIEKNPKFEIYLDKGSEYRLRLKAKNGQAIAAGEGYKSKTGCQNGIESVKKNSADAILVEEKK